MSYKTVNEYLNKLSAKDMEILKSILESRNDEPETFDSVLIKGIKHNQRIIDERIKRNIK